MSWKLGGYFRNRLRIHFVRADSLEGHAVALKRGQDVRDRASFASSSGGRYGGGTRTSYPQITPSPPQPDPCFTTGAYYTGKWQVEQVEARTATQPVVVGFTTTVIDLTWAGGGIQTIQIPQVATISIAVFAVKYRWYYAQFACNGTQLSEWIPTEFTTMEVATFVDDTMAKAIAQSTQAQNQVDAFQRQLEASFQQGLQQAMSDAERVSGSTIERAAIQTAYNILDHVQQQIVQEAPVDIPSTNHHDFSYIDANFVNDANDLDDRTFTIRGAGKAHTYSVGQTLTGRALIESGIIPDTNAEPIDPSSEYVIVHVGLDTTKPRPGVVGMGGTSYPGRITIQRY